MKFILLEHHPHDSRIKIQDDGICQSLTSRMGTGGNNVPMVMVIEDEEDYDRCSMEHCRETRESILCRRSSTNDSYKRDSESGISCNGGTR